MFTAAVSARSVYSIQPCTRSLHESHTRRVHACLAATCHLHFWQNDRDLLLATAVTRNGYRNSQDPKFQPLLTLYSSSPYSLCIVPALTHPDTVPALTHPDTVPALTHPDTVPALTHPERVLAGVAVAGELHGPGHADLSTVWHLQTDLVGLGSGKGRHGAVEHGRLSRVDLLAGELHDSRLGDCQR